jgi:peptidyl-prolyl cis-trans isomerase SurA
LVGNSVILLSDVESDAIYMQSMGYVSDRNVRCEALENIMVTKLFYTQAVLDSLAVNPDMVDAMLSQQVDGILSRFGGEKAVEAYFKKPMHELREGWRNRIMEESLANEMRRTIAGKVPEVTPKEVERFYKRTSKDSLPVIPTQYKISEITLYPNVEPEGYGRGEILPAGYALFRGPRKRHAWRRAGYVIQVLILARVQ